MVQIDNEYPDVKATVIAFGSCHATKKVKAKNRPIIWDAISKLEPDAFIWTGDTVYTGEKGVSGLDSLKQEYEKTLHNETFGYVNFLNDAHTKGYLKGGIHGTWDDHDYGANDHGTQMSEKKERQNLFLDFLGVADEDKERRENRNGVYSSITFGEAPQKVKVVLLDTRHSRDKHCIPSVGAAPLPFGLGSVFACLTRYFSSALSMQNWISKCKNGKVLSDEQWTWLEDQIQNTDAQVNVVVSSIQVLSSNPMMETWGQFPNERTKLLKLLNSLDEGKSVVLLSGDVHHAEIADSSTKVRKSMGRLIEVTSSGLTHTCTDPFYGFLCSPTLKKWSDHRFRNQMETNFYTGKNFGSIEINWANESDEGAESEMKINVHDALGRPVLTTGSLPITSYESHFDARQIREIPHPIDGHLVEPAARLFSALFLILVSLFLKKFLFQKAFDVQRARKLKEEVKMKDD